MLTGDTSSVKMFVKLSNVIDSGISSDDDNVFCELNDADTIQTTGNSENSAARIATT